MNNKPTLLELCLSPDLGGLELYMARAAIALKNDFHLISVVKNNSKLAEYLKDEPLFTLNKSNNILPIYAAIKLANIIDKEKVDIVHMHWTKDMPLAVLAKKISKRKPHIVQTRNMVMTRFKDDLYHKFLYANLSMMLPVTHQVADQLKRFIPENIRPKIEPIYMGTPLVKPIANKEELQEKYHLHNHFIVGIVGRIEKGKGQHLLIQAVANLVKQGKKIKILIVGHYMNDQAKQLIDQTIEQTNMQDSVVFSGFVKEPQQLMQLCDTVVLATKMETFGLVLIEAMQSGVTVIGSDQGGVPEIIEHEQTGLLFQSQDVSSLQTQISTLYEQPELKHQLAKQGQHKAQTKFLDTTQFTALSNSFKELL
jgi:glycosyltransferase involved in cell wall biosynthesis